MFQAPAAESATQRQQRMLTQVGNACMACTMCELGRRGVSRDDKIYRDPHVFSSRTPSRFFLVGQNPGWEEVVQCEPLVGPSGQNFFTEAAKYGIDRLDFYVCNAARCHTVIGQQLLDKHLQRCEPFLAIEINLMRPLLVVALGAVAFGRLCPVLRFSDYLGDIVHSEKFDVDVFTMYHPSPRNLDDDSRLAAFRGQVRTMAALVKHLKSATP